MVKLELVVCIVLALVNIYAAQTLRTVNRTRVEEIRTLPVSVKDENVSPLPQEKWTRKVKTVEQWPKSGWMQSRRNVPSSTEEQEYEASLPRLLIVDLVRAIDFLLSELEQGKNKTMTAISKEQLEQSRLHDAVKRYRVFHKIEDMSGEDPDDDDDDDNDD
jgi:hypothetical protein